jgi:hypothetical protein
MGGNIYINHWKLKKMAGGYGMDSYGSRQDLVDTITNLWVLQKAGISCSAEQLLGSLSVLHTISCKVYRPTVHCFKSKVIRKFSLPVCDAVQSDTSSLTFRRNVLPPSSGSKSKPNKQQEQLENFKSSAEFPV